jgi:uncharacterized protein YegL
MEYKNKANRNHPATVIFLVDVSGSMDARMADGKRRIEIAKDGILAAYTAMISKAMRQGEISPRYRVAMIGYTNQPYDIYYDYGSIITIDKLQDEGVPDITPQYKTNMAEALKYAIHLIKKDIDAWSPIWRDKCPPPMVINLTDCELNEELEDPAPYAEELKRIAVPDGNVLLENIFITNYIKLPTADPKDWAGYKFTDTTGDPYGDKILAMSSPIPREYTVTLSEQAGVNISAGNAMMFPGINREFIKAGFVMSIGTEPRIGGDGLREKFHEENPD